MFQIKFCLKTYEICSSNYFVQILVVRSKCQGEEGKDGLWGGGEKNSREAAAPLLPAPMVFIHSAISIIKNVRILLAIHGEKFDHCDNFSKQQEWDN